MIPKAILETLREYGKRFAIEDNIATQLMIQRELVAEKDFKPTNDERRELNNYIDDILYNGRYYLTEYDCFMLENIKREIEW